METRNQTIAEMKKLIEEAAAKWKTREATGSASLVSEDELERVVGDFSRREQQMYGNLDYVRKASGGLQTLSSELATHVSERESCGIDSALFAAVHLSIVVLTCSAERDDAATIGSCSRVIYRVRDLI